MYKINFTPEFLIAGDTVSPISARVYISCHGRPTVTLKWEYHKIVVHKRVVSYYK